MFKRQPQRLVVSSTLDEERRRLVEAPVLEKPGRAPRQKFRIRVLILAGGDGVHDGRERFEQSSIEAQVHRDADISGFMKQNHSLLWFTAIEEAPRGRRHRVRRRSERQVHQFGVHPRRAREASRVAIPTGEAEKCNSLAHIVPRLVRPREVKRRRGIAALLHQSRGVVERTPRAVHAHEREMIAGGLVRVQRAFEVADGFAKPRPPLGELRVAAEATYRSSSSVSPRECSSLGTSADAHPARSYARIAP